MNKYQKKKSSFKIIYIYHVIEGVKLTETITFTFPSRNSWMHISKSRKSYKSWVTQSLRKYLAWTFLTQCFLGETISPNNCDDNTVFFLPLINNSHTICNLNQSPTIFHQIPYHRRSLVTLDRTSREDNNQIQFIP